MPRGYDPKLESRKNKQRIYGQKEVKAAIFKAGETVEFIDGSWAGLKLEVTKQGDDMVDLEGMVFGRATKITAYPEDLQKSA
jgi:transcription antitermination factor NusG